MSILNVQIKPACDGMKQQHSSVRVCVCVCELESSSVCMSFIQPALLGLNEQTYTHKECVYTIKEKLVSGTVFMCEWICCTVAPQASSDWPVGLYCHLLAAHTPCCQLLHTTLYNTTPHCPNVTIYTTQLPALNYTTLYITQCKTQLYSTALHSTTLYYQNFQPHVALHLWNIQSTLIFSLDSFCWEVEEDVIKTHLT